MDKEMGCRCITQERWGDRRTTVQNAWRIFVYELWDGFWWINFWMFYVIYWSKTDS